MAEFDAKAFGAGMAATIREFVEREVGPLRQRLEELEAAQAVLHARAMAFRGVHQRALSYERGDCVTANSALWVAVRAVEEGELPGASSGWQLAVKAGAR